MAILVASGSEPPIVSALKAAGWDVETAPDALMLHNVVRRAKPVAAVIDAALPRGGAQLALKWIRSNVACANIPVVVLNDTPARDHIYMDGGAQTTLPLPVDVARLVTVLRQHLKAPLPAVNGPPASVIEDPMRLAALRASGLLDSKPDQAFDDITRLIVELLQTPTALLSVVDKNRQFFKSLVGMREPQASARQTPLSHSFCQWVVSGKERITIADARNHPVLKGNSAIRDLGVIAYTGVPVCSADGQALGSLCALDAKPREWTPAQVEILQDLAKLVEAAVAHAMVLKQPPRDASEFDRYVVAAGDALNAAVRLVRRNPLTAQQREILLASIERHGAHLVQLNRLIQVSQALAPPG